MATGEQYKVDYKLVSLEILTLKTAELQPLYTGLVVSGGMLMVTDEVARNVRLHRLSDGKLLAASDKLESDPSGICFINNTTICVTLWSKLVIMSIGTPGERGSIKRVKTFNLNKEFDLCHGVVTFRNNAVVAGIKCGIILYGIVSLEDGTVHTVHQICKGGVSHLTANLDKIYISCYSGHNSPEDTGVYGCSIQNPRKQTFVYKHEDLQWPRCLTVDANGFIFVCNYSPRCIHQLTDTCELVTIYRESIPSDFYAIFSDLGVLYVTCWRSNVIARYKLAYSHQKGVPVEILNMDNRSIQLFEEALKDGKECVYRIRVMVVGHMGVGKTTLIKRLLGKEVNISERQTTEGIDVHVNCCDVSLSNLEWTLRENGVTPSDISIVSHYWRTWREARVRLRKITTVVVWKSLESGETWILAGFMPKLKSLDKTERERKTPVKFEKSGPLLGTPPSHKNFQRQMSAEETSDLEKYEWYYKDIDREQSETLLKGERKSDCFIVRDSSVPGSYAISCLGEILSWSETQVFHYLINKSSDNKFYLVNGQEFNTIPELVDYYRHNEGVLVAPLGNPPIRKKDDIVKTSIELGSEQNDLLQRLAKVLNEQQSKIDKVDNEAQAVVVPKKTRTRQSHDLVIVKDNNIEVLYDCSPQQNIGQNRSSPDSQQGEAPTALVQTKPTQSETNTMAMLKLLKKNVEKLKLDTGKILPLSIWDFAGQFAFYTTHQTFLTRRAIYLMVTDISGHVTDLVADEYYFDSEGVLECKVRELFEVWLNSIHSCAPSHESGIPPVILVGTHVDKIMQIDRHEICEGYFKEIRTYLSDKPTRFHLVDEDFAIDNTIVDSKLEDLKRKIVEVATQQPYWGEEIPARWLLLEQALMRFRADGIKVIPRVKLEDLNQTGAVQIATDELDLFLRFQHEIGTILYFSTEILKDNIVLDPQWMIDALKSLITAEIFVLRSALAVADKWFVFKNTGKLYPELIDAVWTKETNPFLHDNKQHIVLLMEHLNIIAKPRCYCEDGSEIKVENYFLAPCMLREKTPREVIFPELKPEMENSSVIGYIFRAKFLPSPIFHRLLASCLAHWPIAKKKSENLIFCGCCVFDLDLQHRLTVLFREHVIFARVTRIGTNENTRFFKLCSEVREFITKTLTSVTGYLGQNLQFELSIQCPQTDGYSIDCLIPVADLQGNVDVPCHFHDQIHVIQSNDILKFWFQEEEHLNLGSSTGPMTSPSTSETDSFMRIAYLLVDVGSQVLRQLLHHHTVTPTRTLDQYLANHRNTINGLLKKKVLNNFQLNILFPPNGSNTNLDEYDITLLSALFNNIVPSLSQQEMGMIKALREERNKLYGHAKSCKMNAHDYQKYWKSIGSTLITLSKQCGVQFETKMALEIQRIQVSAIPAGSYLDILKRWFDRTETVEGALKALTSRVEALELK